MKLEETASADPLATAPRRSIRIFTACHGTQLLVIQHLRRHLDRPLARELLFWCPLDDSQVGAAFLESVIPSAGFDSTFDARSLQSFQAREGGSVKWWFESARRLRHDASVVRSWLAQNSESGEALELWADDPIHFNVLFCKALFQEARQVKYPHCFNLEDSTCSDYRQMIVENASNSSWVKRRLFWPWLNLLSGCDLDPGRTMTYDLGYTFDQPSCWAAESVDVSQLISLKRFEETLSTLPLALRQEMKAIVGPIQDGRRPLVLLLLFGLDGVSQEAYRRSLARVFRTRSNELRNCTLAIKVHPAARGVEEEALFEWAAANLPVDVFPIRSVLNLEFMLPLMQPDFVLAGPCGALPIVRRLGVSRAIVLPEILDIVDERFPAERANSARLVEGLEVW